MQVWEEADSEVYAHGGTSINQREGRSKGELHGLVSGKEAWLQVSAKGADGQGPWSQPVRCMVP